MTEYFVVANSFAAPFVSDQSTHFVDGVSPESALRSFAETYTHPCGLYSANLYASADAYHKGHAPLVKWLSNHEQALQRHSKGLGAYLYEGHGPDSFSIDGKSVKVSNPKSGSVIKD